MSLIYGRQPVREVLASGRPVRRVLYCDDHAREIQFLVAQASSRGIVAQQVGRALLDELARGGNHQGIAVEAPEREPASIDDALDLARERNEEPLLLLLDHLQDPQNFGTLLRTADAVGVHGVVIPTRRAAGVTAAVARSSAGAVEHLLVVETANLVQVIEELKGKRVWVAGLDQQAAQDSFSIEAGLPLAIVVGSEGSGLSRLAKKKCDFLVSLPMRGHVASLNASVAGSIVLYDIWRRRAA
ncbi:MAG: 23S rRNA (guanosine(2251)-2'-O)-methyltransferase RlmB, partial [Chloroflexota bacterium]|nr:23S rRNA (guanosine(2251)-2'-O)-methyltransferase RlmB [Chloroflexota bacterium]